jgi:uncharacterized protein YecE (DUF72 family)
VAEKYDYRYSGEELAAIAQRVRVYHGKVRRVSVTFNNNKDDYPIVNALDLKRLLGLPGNDIPSERRRFRAKRASTLMPSRGCSCRPLTTRTTP